MFQVDGGQSGPVPHRAVVLSDGNAHGLPQAQRHLLAGDVSHVSVDVTRSRPPTLGRQARRSVKVALVDKLPSSVQSSAVTVSEFLF